MTTKKVTTGKIKRTSKKKVKVPGFPEGKRELTEEQAKEVKGGASIKIFSADMT